MLLSLSSSEEALGLRGVFAVRDEPSRVTPSECGVVLEPAFELGDPGRPAAEYVAAALDADHRRMVIVDGAGVDDDLVRDMTELMTSLCARLYGRRSAAHRAAKAIEAATVGGDHDG